MSQRHERCQCSVQVRLATNRNQDLRMNGGRAEVEAEYDIGFDNTGRIHALEIQVLVLGFLQGACSCFFVKSPLSTAFRPASAAVHWADKLPCCANTSGFGW